MSQKDKFELALIFINYAWMFALLPFSVVLGSILLGGFLVGAIVTVTHQSEEIISPLYVHATNDSRRNKKRIVIVTFFRCVYSFFMHSF